MMDPHFQMTYNEAASGQSDSGHGEALRLYDQQHQNEAACGGSA